MRVIDRERIAMARKRQGYTQRDLAALARCSQAAIGALETGAMTGCSKDLALTLAKWLDRDVRELFEARENTRVHRVTNSSGVRRKPLTAVAA